jgi:hypothetical protein
MLRPAAEDFRASPTRYLFERVAVDEAFEFLFGFPAAQYQE